MNEQWIKGSCLCGEIQFRIRNPYPQLAHCHCEDCRKFHGAAFSTFAEVSGENLEMIDPSNHLKTFTADNGSRRSFCGNCGSSLLFQGREQVPNIEIAIATLDSTCNFEPDAHIFYSQKVSWFEPGDELPKIHRNRLR